MGLFCCVPKPLKMLFDVASLQSGKIEPKKYEKSQWRSCRVKIHSESFFWTQTVTRVCTVKSLIFWLVFIEKNRLYFSRWQPRKLIGKISYFSESIQKGVPIDQKLEIQKKGHMSLIFGLFSGAYRGQPEHRNQNLEEFQCQSEVRSPDSPD